MEYIEGIKDGVRRQVCRISGECRSGYTWALLELERGRWVRQIVQIARIKRSV